MEREQRAGKAPEVRADGEQVQVEGLAAVFNEWTDIGGLFEERIAPGAFSEALSRGDDVEFLVNHAGLPLARSTSGTLTLSQDKAGLRMAATLDTADPDVQAVVPKLQRGDLSAMSFAFLAEKESWDETGSIPRRTIEQVRLFDVAVVNRPAYAGTEIGLRALEEFRARIARQHNFAAAESRVARRMRMNLRLRAVRG